MKLVRLRLRRKLRKQREILLRPEWLEMAALNRKVITAAALPAHMSAKCDMHEEQIDGMRVVRLVPKFEASGWHIIYTHGGAYVSGLITAHWDIVDALIEATGATVTVPLYPLAPESNHRCAYAFLKAVYLRVLAITPSANVVLAGDSAGAALALGQALEYREAGLPMPARVITFAPWLDISLADPAALAVESHDIVLGIEGLRHCGLWWAAGDDPHTPRLSPLYADVRGLPPIDLYQGTHDLLVVDARTFAAKVLAAGGRMRYFEYAGGFHVFMAARFTPEAKDVFKKVGRTLPKTRPCHIGGQADLTPEDT